MADYQRFVSYIYSYPGGVKDKNVGFAKVEVRAGEMRLNINLRGVYTDTPQMFGVHMLIDRDTSIPGRYRLMKVGDCIVNNGMASYAGIFNASNIDNTGYASSDICGIAVANKGDRYYMMFSMWEDYDVNPDVIEFAGSDVRKYRISDTKENVKKASEENAGCVSKEGIDTAYKDTESKYSESQNGRIKAAAYKDKKNRHNEAAADINVRESMESIEKMEELHAMECMDNTENTDNAENTYNTDNVDNTYNTDNTDNAYKTAVVNTSVKKKCVDSNEHLYKKLYSKADYVDAFDDDYFYDCIEVTPQMLSKLPLKDKEIINNSFLIHGYYNFHHLLFGRVCDNENNTNYFIGVPGMYCNRERYMASMFGFCNFKKSHRSDYNNPYFGYWYQEI